MIGFSRSHSGDRFYNPPAVRRQQRQLLEQQKQHKPKALASDSGEAENRVEMDDSATKLSAFSAQPRPLAGNLDRFIQFTNPVVPAQYSSWTREDWRTCDPESPLYFSLGDLWESFREWSAYGAGVPLVLDAYDNVVQYYVPYLSGIQLYVDSSNQGLVLRQPVDESDTDSFMGSSGESSDSDTISRTSKLSVREKLIASQECFSSDDTDSPQSLPVFEYLERDPPYLREPLADKISTLACRYPQLRTYNSCDLLPSSWISVAWYPIYRIPTGPTLKDLDACYLSYHSLSTSLRSGFIEQPQICYSKHRKLDSQSDTSPQLSLPIFALASYKFKPSVWIANGAVERQQASSLFQAAENWLRLLQVDHPDYSFFLSHKSYRI